MLNVALKEWSIICDLLLEGRLAILLRKGGIHEYGGPGRFELEHDCFALFPAWEHQRPDRIKPGHREHVIEFDHEPEEIALRGFGEVRPEMPGAGAIWQVPGRAAFDRLDDLHPWTEAQIDMRFNYKPDRPLYLLALRVHRLPEPRTIPNRDAYAGCKSWVPLTLGDEVDDQEATPVLSDAAFARIVERVDAAMRQR